MGGGRGGPGEIEVKLPCSRVRKVRGEKKKEKKEKGGGP